MAPGLENGMARKSKGTRRAKETVPAMVAREGARPSRAPDWLERDWLLGSLLIVAVLLAYIPIWRAGFVWDDDLHLTANPCIVGPYGLSEIWTRGGPLQSFPLVISTFWLEHALWGLNPLPYHLLNVFLQAACAVLLWQILRSLRIPGAWLGAALWALHPLQVESVAWISEMKNTESCLFYLLAILFYVRSLPTEKGAREFDWNYALTLLFSALAMASKPSTVVLPAVLFLCAWWMEKRWDRRHLLRLLPVVAMAVLATANTVIQRPPYQDVLAEPQWDRTWPERIATAGNAIWFYLGKMVWPGNLMMVYPRWQIDATQWISYLPLLAAVILFAYLWWKRNSTLRPAFFAYTYFLVVLSPFLGLIDQSFFRLSLVEDHLQYLAAMGPLALAGAGLTWLANLAFAERRWLQPTLSAAFVLVLGVVTWQRVAVFENRETLWRDTLAKNSACWIGHYDLGNALVRRGEKEAAMEEFQKAVEINPGFDKAHNNLGNALLDLGRVDEAIIQFQAAQAANPKDYMAYVSLADAFLHQGRMDDAIVQLQKAIAIVPDYYLAHLDLGNALFLRKGEVDGAIAEYQKALQANPGVAEAHNFLGLALAQKGQLALSIAQFQEALRLAPNYAAARENLLKTEALVRQNASLSH
jgi:tetratricopeptide (TPR) repeat protein